MTWQSEFQTFNVSNPVFGPVTVTLSSYALVNLNASYRISDRWRATFAVRNAFDKTYWSRLRYRNYGEPRYYVLTLRWQY